MHATPQNNGVVENCHRVSHDLLPGPNFVQLVRSFATNAQLFPSTNHVIQDLFARSRCAAEYCALCAPEEADVKTRLFAKPRRPCRTIAKGVMFWDQSARKGISILQLDTCSRQRSHLRHNVSDRG